MMIFIVCMSMAALMLTGCATTNQTASKIAKLEESNQELNERLNRLATAKSRCTAALAADDRLDEQRRKELRQALSEIESLRTNLQMTRRMHKELLRVLAVPIKAGRLSVIVRNGMITLQMPEKVLFELNKAKLNATGRDNIQEIANILKRYKQRWQVTGHTDTTGETKYNWNLSIQRAKTVMFEMINTGMSPKMISMAGFGEFQPVAPNDSKEHRALNRRIEIVLVPNLSRVKFDTQASATTGICTSKTS